MYTGVGILELAVLALARIMCANIHSQNGTAILAQVYLDHASEHSEKYFFSPSNGSHCFGGNGSHFSHVGGSQNRQCSGTRTWHTATTSKRWLAFTGVSFS